MLSLAFLAMYAGKWHSSRASTIVPGVGLAHRISNRLTSRAYFDYRRAKWMRSSRLPRLNQATNRRPSCPKPGRFFVFCI